MKVNIIEDEQKSLVIEFEDADRSIAELIREKLQEKSDVDFAAVTKTHFEVGKPRLIVKSSKNAKKLVLEAIEEIKEELKEFKSQLPKK
ncbi:MAG: RpoL/Rpb11 RNA polymerase subunit family protein [Candidatus Micrarchaeia archaeon]|jgi:DNA-directed RNA polymerase subunit L